MSPHATCAVSLGLWALVVALRACEWAPVARREVVGCPYREAAERTTLRGGSSS